MSIKLMMVGNCSWASGSDLDELFQLSDEATELQKIVQFVKDHMTLTLIMKC